MLDDDIKCVGNYVNEGFGLTTPVMESFNRIITELREAQERADNSAMDAMRRLVLLVDSCESTEDFRNRAFVLINKYRAAQHQ